jgi:hypothetical protein
MTNVNNLGDDDWLRQAEQNLYDIANGAEGMAEKLDKEGFVHELRYKLPPNLDANKFILKNKSGGKWADKVEITSTQINLNLTASYNQVNELIEKQRQQVIDAEFKVLEDNE